MQVIKGVKSYLSTISELLAFLWGRKLWWLIPMVFVLLLLALLLIVAQASSIAPFIYPLV